MLQIDEGVLEDLVNNYSAREVLCTLHEIYKRKADNCADMGLKEKSAAYADISDSLDALHDVCDPNW